MLEPSVYRLKERLARITEWKNHACTIGYLAMRVRELKALSLSGTFIIEGNRSESSVDLRLHACEGLKPLQDDAR
jgi:hypothetical protein